MGIARAAEGDLAMRLNLASVVTVDLHGKTAAQARVAIDAALRRAGGGVYRVRLIHGYRLGAAIKDMIFTVYVHHRKVLRLEPVNDGATDLVLREL